jgi:ribosomal protein S18 acetylase RimI-like enzyme
MILYICITILSIIIFFLLYIKLKHRFWAGQPVFHFYDLYYYFFNTGIIRHELPKKNKYTNFTKIEFKTFMTMLPKQKKQFLFLIQNNYLKNKDNVFYPQWNNIVSYFMGHSHPSFVSFYYEPVLLEDTKNQTFIDDKKLVGVMTSRPLYVTININGNNINTNSKTFELYYIDYLCVDKAYRKKDIASQLIQTHEYQQSHKNKKISVSLFKREGELTSIVPMCIYKTYCFDMSNWMTPYPLPIQVSLIHADTQNIFHVWNFIKEQTQQGKWKIIVTPTITNIIEVIKSFNTFVEILVIEQEIAAVYFFRKVCTSISKGKNVISCFASIHDDSKITDELFVHGFKVSLSCIIKKNPDFHYLCVEDISDNHFILSALLLKNKPYVVSPTAYFFYNFAYQTFPSNTVLMIN